MTERKGPVLIELDDAPDQGPAAAPPVTDPPHALPEGRAMQVASTLAAARPNRVARLFWAALLSLIGFVASLSAWNFVTGLLASNPILGLIATALMGLVLITLLILALRELAAILAPGSDRRSAPTGRSGALEPRYHPGARRRGSAGHALQIPLGPNLGTPNPRQTPR